MARTAGSVAEVLAENCEGRIPFKRLGLPSVFSSHVGTQEYLLAMYGLDAYGVRQSLKSILDLVRD